MIYAKLNASCVLCTRVQGQSKRSDCMSKKKPDEKKAGEKEAELNINPVLLLIMMQLINYATVMPTTLMSKNAEAML